MTSFGTCPCARRRALEAENLEIYREKSRRLREVAGAGTKGRYDQRLPSVSFALGLNVCLID